jgi:hypothetical protein
MSYKNKMCVLARIIHACLCLCACFSLTGCCNGDNRSDITPSRISPELSAELIQSNLLYKISQEPNYKEETRRFLEQIRHSQKPEQLRDWASQVLEDHKNAKQGVDIPSAEVPSFIKNLDPSVGEPRVWVVPHSHVMIDWGGGFGHWGLIVEGDQPRDHSYLYTIDWVAGLKAYHSLQ